MKDQVITVEGLPQEVCGGIVFWRLGGQVSMIELAKAWSDKGLPPEHLPNLPGSETALRRAMNSVQEKRLRVRPLSHGRWAVVKETVDVDADDLEHETVLKVSLNKDTEELTFQGRGADLKKTVEARFLRELTSLSSNDISSWLSGPVLGRLKAIPLRDSGGAYFIPRQAMETWTAISKAVDKASSAALHTIPALRTSDAIEAILEALTSEVTQTVQGIEDQIKGGDLGKRALGNRGDQAETLLVKVQEYEKLLGKNLTKLKQSVRGVKAASAAAILALEDEDEDDV